MSAALQAAANRHREAGLKAVTGGHGSYTMTLARYDQAPPNVQQQLAAEYAKHRKHEED